MRFDQHRIETPLCTFHCLKWTPDTETPRPVAVLLHGFPETPKVFESLAGILVERGYTVIAPWLPGYGTAPSLAKRTGRATFLHHLAEAFGSLISVIATENTVDKVTLVGHDWGAVCAYATAAAHPEKLDRLVTMAVPPLSVFLGSFLRLPGQWRRSAYMVFMQPGMNVPESLLQKRDYRRLQALCLDWSGGVATSEAYFRDADNAFSSLGDLNGPLSYYRGLFPILSGSGRRWLKAIRLAYRKISVPTVILVGERDGCIPAPCYEGFERQFSEAVTFTIIPNAGHFLPIDAPQSIADAVTQEIL